MINYSIIIPHYNIPELLVRCLRSIPRRDDIQVIVVDDGSPDADKYLERYPELTAPGVEFYPVPHQGLAGEMRNIGLRYAVGKWVTFLDADDLLSDNADDIFDKNIDFEEDIIFYHSISVLSDDLTVPYDRYLYQPFLDEYTETGNANGLRYSFHSIWGKIFRRAFLEKHHIQWSKTKYSNDVLFSMTAGHYARTIKVVDEILYIVTRRIGSLTYAMRESVPSLEECKIRLGVAINCRNFLDSHNVETEDRSLENYLSKIRIYYRKEYFRQVTKLLFTHPSYYIDSFFLKDLRCLRKKIFYLLNYLVDKR